MKIKRIAVFSSLAAAVILICGCILSYIYFETPNCFSAAVGFVRDAAGNGQSSEGTADHKNKRSRSDI